LASFALESVRIRKNEGIQLDRVESMSYRSRIQEGVSRQIGPFSCGQKDDVGQAAEGLNPLALTMAA
jgi:hypothetical protein